MSRDRAAFAALCDALFARTQCAFGTPQRFLRAYGAPELAPADALQRLARAAWRDGTRARDLSFPPCTAASRSARGNGCRACAATLRRVLPAAAGRARAYRGGEEPEYLYLSETLVLGELLTRLEEEAVALSEAAAQGQQETLQKVGMLRLNGQRVPRLTASASASYVPLAPERYTPLASRTDVQAQAGASAAAARFQQWATSASALPQLAVAREVPLALLVARVRQTGAQWRAGAAAFRQAQRLYAETLIGHADAQPAADGARQLLAVLAALRVSQEDLVFALEQLRARLLRLGDGGLEGSERRALCGQLSDTLAKLNRWDARAQLYAVELRRLLATVASPLFWHRSDELRP